MEKTQENFFLDKTMGLAYKEIIDLNAKRIFNAKYMTKFQFMSTMKGRTVKFRDDLSDTELRMQEKKVDLAEQFIIAIKKTTTLN